MPGNVEPVSGFEPLTCRLQEVLSPLGPWSHGIYASPAQPRSCWSAGLRDHNNNHAAVCREVPFGLWVSGGGALRSVDLWDFCGPRGAWATATRATTNLASCLGRIRLWLLQ